MMEGTGRRSETWPLAALLDVTPVARLYTPAHLLAQRSTLRITLGGRRV